MNRIHFTAAISIFAFVDGAVFAQEATVCRFQSVDGSGRQVISGTLVRTAQAALIEYESGAPPSVLTCPTSPFHCESKTAEQITTADFSYPGFMVLVSNYVDIDMTVIGLAHVNCGALKS